MTNRPKPPHILNSPLYSPIWTEIYEKDLDGLIAFCGRRGYCKSGSAETFGWSFDLDTNWQPRFNAEDHVFFKASEFSTQIEQKYPKGTVFLWDEVGVENDSRSWYSTKNKFIKYIMETYRDKNYVLLVTAPTLKSMDIATQRLLTGYVEMKGKTGDGNMAVGKFEYVEVSPKTGKTYYKMPRYWNDGEYCMLRDVYFPRPPKELDDAYRLKKLEYQKNLYHNITEELKFMAGKIGGESVDRKQNYTVKEMVDMVKAEPLKFFDVKRKMYAAALIEYELNVTSILSVRAARVLNMLPGALNWGIVG